MTNANNECLLKVKLDWGFWFIDWINADCADAMFCWMDEYEKHPLYWEVVEEFGNEPDSMDLTDAYYYDDFETRQPFKFFLLWYKFVCRIADLFYWFKIKCDRLSAYLFKCHVYELPWYS